MGRRQAVVVFLEKYKLLYYAYRDREPIYARMCDTGASDEMVIRRYWRSKRLGIDLALWEYAKRCSDLRRYL